MFYKLLGMVVWKGAKLFLKRKAAGAAPGRPALAGGVALIVLATVAAVVFQKKHHSA